MVVEGVRDSTNHLEPKQADRHGQPPKEEARRSGPYPPSARSSGLRRTFAAAGRGVVTLALELGDALLLQLRQRVQFRQLPPQLLDRDRDVVRIDRRPRRGRLRRLGSLPP